MYLFARSLICACFLLSDAQAAVVELRIDNRTEIADGLSFGSAGRYERIIGRVSFAIDPQHPTNRVIVDIDRAPRNPQGMVEFAADVYILRPVDLAKGNGTVLFDALNRGKKGLLQMFNRARASNDPVSGEDLGDGLLLNEGYTLVWVGWQNDVPRTEGLMRLYAPVARGIKGLVRSEYTAAAGVTVIPLGDADHIAHPVSRAEKVTVSVRYDIHGSQTLLPKSKWKLDAGRILLSSPAPAAAIYEVIYESADPVVAGVGLAAIRDLISYLKRDYRYALGFGISQSGILLRSFLYEGFNQDENGKRVFDGVFVHVAGARRSTFQRFTQPSRTAGPLRNASLSTTEQFPFADNLLREPGTGIEDGLLAKAAQANVVPKIFYTNSSYEYWGSGASLLHTTPDGIADVPLSGSTRLYVFTGGQHGPAAFPPSAGRGRLIANFNDYRWSMRALLQRLRQWVASDTAPPNSMYPTIAEKTLVPMKQYAFPVLPGVSLPAGPYTLHAVDFGSKYRASGVITREPPRMKRAFTTLIPQADVDGNDLGGLRMPELDCAIGAFTGWSLRHPNIGFEKHLLSNAGSYLPFARTAAERAKLGDPRRSIEERFADQSSYIACVDSRADALIASGLLLPEDKRPIRESAARHWQWRMQQPALVTSTPRD